MTNHRNMLTLSDTAAERSFGRWAEHRNISAASHTIPSNGGRKSPVDMVFYMLPDNKAITVGNRQSFITAYLEKGLGILTYSMDRHT